MALTVSSDAAARMLWADGPPCRTPFEEIALRWSTDEGTKD
jgi:hypothetical protein